MRAADHTARDAANPWVLTDDDPSGRPVFQEMMARLKAESDIDYVIVYARSRLHRNSIDAAITKRDLRRAGVTLISIMDYTEDNDGGTARRSTRTDRHAG